MAKMNLNDLAVKFGVEAEAAEDSAVTLIGKNAEKLALGLEVDGVHVVSPEEIKNRLNAAKALKAQAQAKVAPKAETKAQAQARHTSVISAAAAKAVASSPALSTGKRFSMAPKEQEERFVPATFVSQTPVKVAAPVVSKSKALDLTEVMDFGDASVLVEENFDMALYGAMLERTTALANALVKAQGVLKGEAAIRAAAVAVESKYQTYVSLAEKAANGALLNQAQDKLNGARLAIKSADGRIAKIKAAIVVLEAEHVSLRIQYSDIIEAVEGGLADAYAAHLEEVAAAALALDEQEKQAYIVAMRALITNIELRNELEAEEAAQAAQAALVAECEMVARAVADAIAAIEAHNKAVEQAEEEAEFQRLLAEENAAFEAKKAAHAAGKAAAKAKRALKGNRKATVADEMGGEG